MLYGCTNNVLKSHFNTDPMIMTSTIGDQVPLITVGTVGLRGAIFLSTNFLQNIRNKCQGLIYVVQQQSMIVKEGS